MRFSILAALLLFAFGSVVFASGESEIARPITQADSIIAIYAEDWRLYPTRWDSLVLAAWPDGHIVWSEDRIRGGAPYRAGQIGKKAVMSLLSRFEREAVFSDNKLAKPNFGPDSEFTTILLKFGRKQLQMRSWHELYDGERSRFEDLRKEPSELFYRFAWSEIRAAAVMLVPDDSNRVEGKVRMKAGIMSWHEVSGGTEKGTKR